MATFEVGEIAIAVRRQDGMRADCEIIAVPGHRMSGFSSERYVIHVPENPCADHHTGYHIAVGKYLRKKKPPKEEEASWEQIQKLTGGWNPTKEKVHG